MVIKTELCVYTEYKIYPGRGQKFIAKDGKSNTKQCAVLSVVPCYQSASFVPAPAMFFASTGGSSAPSASSESMALRGEMSTGLPRDDEHGGGGEVGEWWAGTGA